MLPAWIVRDGDRLKVHTKKAVAVRTNFKLAIGGYGHAAMVKKLTSDKVPPIGICAHWSRSYIASILRDRRAVGEFQPRKRDGSVDGPPIPDYFPRVVTDAEYYAARAAAGKRRSKISGSVNRVGKHVNVFAGLISGWKNESSTYYCATRTDGGNTAGY